MTALDTNILVRYLVNDDPKQAGQAKALVDRLDRNDERAYVSDIVMCELTWVLGSVYGFKRNRIVFVLKQLAAARQLGFDSADNILHAIKAYEDGKGDFADYLIREHAKMAGCESVSTFDKRLLGDGMFISP